MAEACRIERLGYALATLKVGLELARWRNLGVRPLLWWRDDDARAPSVALDRLLELADGRPLALAVIPDGRLDPLAQRLRREQRISIGQHGVDHTNRRGADQAPSEYADPPNDDELTENLIRGRIELERAGLAPSFYTPPWNAVEAGLAKAVLKSGIPILSAGAAPVVYADLRYLPAEIDVLRWKRGPAFKGAPRVMSALRRALAQRRRCGELFLPIGLLTHHLDHDEATWRFLAWVMRFFDQGFDWVSVDGCVHPRPVATARTAMGVPMAKPLVV